MDGLNMTNWSNVRVEDGRVEWNGRRAIYHQCEASDARPAGYGTFGIVHDRCGADAMYLVTRTNVASGETYTDHMCERHANGWRESK
jgi:hypothetical protein